MKSTSILPIALLSLASIAHAQVPSAEWQMQTALLAAPEDQRPASTILGYNEKGELVTLRTGSNSLICLADDPNKEGFSAACYHKDLEPYMARGRELSAAGKDFQQIFDTREEEVKSGKLSIPEGSVLNVLTGEVNPDSGTIENRYLRYVVYIPYATSASTGLPLQPLSPGAPWIMNPGTHRSHIMINPPKE